MSELTDEGNNAEVWFDFEGVSNIEYKAGKKISISKITAYDKEKYLQAFEKVKGHINRGNTYLLNLTFRSEVEFDKPATLEDLFRCSSAKFKVMLKNEFVCFSPEPFVIVDEDGNISTYPMKGTADAKNDITGDGLLKNEKEIAEHYTIVDLLRNDLALVADDVRVTKFRYLEKIKTAKGDIWQTSSEVTGRLYGEFGKNYGSMIAKLLPAGSISGAPKQRTVEIIENTEEGNRGFYTGIAGLYDGKVLKTAVMIRFIEYDQGSFYYKSGGGIVYDSNPESEYDELIKKIYLPCKD